METTPDDIEDHLRLEFANRCELGIVVWRQHGPERGGRYYNYEDTIAIAHMMIRGWSFADAARMVDASLIIAVPHVPGHTSSKIEVPYLVYGVGFSRLTDGTIWEVLGDVDFPNARHIVEDTTNSYGAVATRNVERSAEPLATRVGNLVTNGEFDAEGRFVAVPPDFAVIGGGQRLYTELRQEEAAPA